MGSKKTPLVQAGYDYAMAILELRSRFTYDRIAEFCGYESKGAIANILCGGIPLHPQGEAIYILYFETFGRKPPAIVQKTEPALST